MTCEGVNPQCQAISGTTTDNVNAPHEEQSVTIYDKEQLDKMACIVKIVSKCGNSKHPCLE